MIKGFKSVVNNKFMWHAVSLFFVADHLQHPKENPLWEEQIILIDSLTDEEAKHKAETFGKASQHSYSNADGETVNWRFVKVERACPIEPKTLVSGTELFSRFLRDGEAKSLLTGFN